MELWKPDGTYTSFSSEDKNTEDKMVFVLRYVMSDEKAEEIIANGGKPKSNTLVTLIYVNKSIGEVYDEGRHEDSWIIK